MASHILICSPNVEWAETVKDAFENLGQKVDITFTGKECQTLIYKGEYASLLLDIETSDCPSIEVIGFAKTSGIPIKISLVILHRDYLERNGLNPQDLINAGASQILIEPIGELELIKSALSVDVYVAKKSENEPAKKEEVMLEWPKQLSQDEMDKGPSSDSEFSSIKLRDFLSGSTNVFDYYVRLSENKYIKLLNKGDPFDVKRLGTYVRERRITHLYVKTSDRVAYVNFVNSLLEKLATSNKAPVKKQIAMAKGVTEKFIEEVYVKGIRSSVVGEGIKICNNVHQIITRSTDLTMLLDEYQETDPPSTSHLFMTALYTCVISKNLKWASGRSVETMVLASILHDIGKLKIPFELREMATEEMTPLQLNKYREHCVLGVEMLRASPIISEQVAQIVHQHHEHIDGTGFPNGLTGNRIYPLAKIVTLADQFVHILVDKKLKPLEALKKIRDDSSLMQRFDQEALTSLVETFEKKDSKL